MACLVKEQRELNFICSYVDVINCSTGDSTGIKVVCIFTCGVALPTITSYSSQFAGEYD